MPKALVIIGGILLILGAIASIQGADASLRLFPALLLMPLGRAFVAGPDIPPHLTQAGILVAYILPGALLIAVGAALLYRKITASTLDPTHNEES